MSVIEATAQQTDPLGVLKQRPITLVVGVFALVLATGRTIFQHDAGTHVTLAVTALLWVALAVAILVASTSPLRAPFTRGRFIAVVTCGVLATVTAAAASAGLDRSVRDDWGSTIIGLLLLSCAPFRPGREILVATITAALVVAVVVWIEAPTFAAQAPAVLFAVIGVTPTVALGVGGAVYSTTFVRLVQQWMDRAESLTLQDADDMRPGIARSVQQDRVTDLNRDVVPFFTTLVERGEVTEADRIRAGAVAATIRERIVADADRTWLEKVLLGVCPSTATGTIVDRSHLSTFMTPDQRSAIRALVNAMAADEATRTSSLGIVLHDDAPLVRALIRIESVSADAAIRQHYAPYFAVLRILFRDLQVDVNGSFLTLRFSYDQH